jgi:hypothetical protein
MRTNKKVALDHSMFTVSDPTARGPVPRLSRSARMGSDSKFLIIGTLMSQDGDTEIVLSDSLEGLAVVGVDGHRPGCVSGDEDGQFAHPSQVMEKPRD